MFLGTIVPRVETTERVVALTLDDGPLQVHTDETLRILAEHDIQATFFVIGKDAKRNMAELRAIVAAGHVVGNHGYTHTMMAFMSPRQIAWELESTDAIVRSAGYAGTIPFRAPYNLKFIALPAQLAHQKRPDVSRDILVSEGSGRTAEQIANDVVKAVKPGSIILLHPMYDHTASSRAAIPLIAEQLRAEGYRFVTVPELLQLVPSQ